MAILFGGLWIPAFAGMTGAARETSDSRLPCVGMPMQGGKAADAPGEPEATAAATSH